MAAMNRNVSVIDFMPNYSYNGGEEVNAMYQNRFAVSIDRISSVYAGSIVYPPGGKFGPRIQRDVQLVMLYSGVLDLSIDGRKLNVKPGHMVILFPNHEESFVFSQTEESWHRWISVHIPDWDSSRAEQLLDYPECVPISEDMNRLLDLMLNIHAQSSSTESVMRTLGLAALQLYPMESIKVLAQREKHPAVYAALTFIHEHYADEIILIDIAHHAGVSPEHLIRLFKQYERTTPIRYIWKLRVKQAASLLTNTGLSITEIAYRCGFKTAHHLARMIKQSTGHTASDIRRLSWKGDRRHSE
jgi:AraC-like DNA-binding protein